jgi:hypothetical protein
MESNTSRTPAVTFDHYKAGRFKHADSTGLCISIYAEPSQQCGRYGHRTLTEQITSVSKQEING